MDLNRWRSKLARLEAAVRPIAKRPVDVNDPERSAKLAARPHPLDEAGVRGEGEALLLDILQGYAGASESERAAIRALVPKYECFFWAARVPEGGTATERIRLKLIHFALIDQQDDPRDVVTWLDHICRTAGVPTDELAALRREVAQMASDADRHGWGSTRSMLLRGYGDWCALESAPERAR